MRSQQGKRVDFPARTCFCAHVCASACASCFCAHSITVLQAIYKPASRASKESSKEYTTQCEYIMSIALESNSQADSRTRLPCVRVFCAHVCTSQAICWAYIARLNPGLCWRSAPCSQSPTDCMSSHQPSVYAARSINGKMQSQKVWPEFLPYHPLFIHFLRIC